MKLVIENKKTTLPKAEDAVVNYAELLSSLLNRPLSKTIDLKGMRRDLRLMDLLDTTEDIELSKEDFDYLKDLVDNSEWTIKHKDIVAFADYIDSLKSE